ncbi:ATP-binding region ATPase domain protein [Coriobacterium glomerans PW2]|uniref:ATP-binding region ATPase domain protein n=1 Tax=Coriobacterium glomerans (strain ATCC 49209 / DSM 20642 / JCM 10262 / PW2) TaxID=700015 RepID=F2N7X7_CORGP|nr:sensor histidine kinase [Coriobacterium glomerans]AEB07086.1 ATP-binding region ATPase domain protein [Coriobacterium glomerans PW2]
MDESHDLISFVASMSGEGSLRVEENLGDGYVRLRISEAERRQAKHDIRCVEDIVIEMLRNARDAGATEIYVATGKDEDIRTLVFIDNGGGIPADMQERIFDARVTSKLENMKMDRWGVHGRGMALFSIRENTREARVIASQPSQGTALLVRVDTSCLSERADQSSWPQAVRDEDGAYTQLRGPHNIVRAACEFGLEELNNCDVFLGTPTEIAATLFLHASARLDASRLLFTDDEGDLPVCERLGCAADAADLMRIAAALGIVISERTAHRILAGSIDPLKSVTARLLRERDSAVSSRPVDLSRDRRGLIIAKEDLDHFSRAMEREFSYLSSRYYVNLARMPRIRVYRNRLIVTFDVDKEE